MLMSVMRPEPVLIMVYYNYDDILLVGLHTRKKFCVHIYLQLNNGVIVSYVNYKV